MGIGNQLLSSPFPLKKQATYTHNKNRKRAFLFRFLLLIASAAASATTPDSIQLRDVEVVSARKAARMHRDGSLNFGAASLTALARTLGEADALNFLKLLPGVTTMSDYSSGVSIDGMNYANNLYLLGDIPVHFPYHFGGFFSTFNPVLYPDIAVSKSIRNASAPLTLGGIVAASQPKHRDGKLHLNANIGMVASSIAIEAPIAKGLTVSAAGRICYLNLFYSGLLGGKNTTIDYDFFDTDIAIHWEVDERNTITASLHHNTDRLGYHQTQSTLLTAMKWHNTIGGISWQSLHSNYSMRHRLYHSYFANRLGMTITEIGVSGNNSFAQTGIEGRIDIYPTDAMTLNLAYNLHHYRYLPQQVSTQGMGTGPTAAERHHSAKLADISADISRQWGIFSLKGGAKLMAYASAGYHNLWANPELTASFTGRRWSTSLHAGGSRQYIHQVGLSEIGMASNFKFGAADFAPPEQAWNFVASASYTPTRRLSLAGDLYYKIIRQQPEYSSTIIELTSPDYNAFDYIHTYSGHNIGGSAMVTFSTDAVQAIASYGYCIARRRMPSTGRMFTPSSEIRHSLKVNGLWKISRHWEVNGTFALASGRPYTPITAMYMIGGRVMIEYGEYNAARMPMYHRLDLGGAYCFTTGRRFKLSHRIELAVLNAYASRNIEMYTYKYDIEKHTFKRRELVSLYSTLPSLSYTIIF